MRDVVLRLDLLCARESDVYIFGSLLKLTRSVTTKKIAFFVTLNHKYSFGIKQHVLQCVPDDAYFIDG